MVGTDEFQALGRMEAKARGLPDLPLALTRHPLGGLKPEAVRAKAADLVQAVALAISAAPVAAVSGGEA